MPTWHEHRSSYVYIVQAHHPISSFAPRTPGPQVRLSNRQVCQNRKANREKNQRYLHAHLLFAFPSFTFLSSWTFDLPFPSLVLLAISHLPPRLDRTNSQSSTNRSAVSSRMKRRMAKAVKWSQVAQLRKKWVEVKCKYNESKTLATSHHSSRRAIRNHQTCRLARPIQHSQDCACPTQSTSRSRPHGSLQKAASSW